MYDHDIYPDDLLDVTSNPVDYMSAIPKEYDQYLARHNVNWAVANLKKNHRIVWYLRWLRLALADRKDTDIDDNFREKEIKRYNKKARKHVNAKSLDLNTLYVAFTGNNVLVYFDEDDTSFRLNQQLQHYLNYNVRAVNEQPFDFLLPDELFEIFEDQIAESQGKVSDKEARQWLAENEEFDYTGPTAIIRGNITHDEALNKFRFILDDYDYDPKPLIEFDDGFTWFDLEGKASEIESNAMDHCGRASDARVSQTLYSLRKPVTYKNMKFWKPVLTFAVGDDGKIREAKGYNNTKPLEKYHQYIVDFIKNDVVEGIAGGGYMPETNFSIRDLDEDEYGDFIETIKEEKEVESLTDRALRDGMSTVRDELTFVDDYGRTLADGTDKEIDIGSTDVEDFINTHGDADAKQYLQAYIDNDISELIGIDVDDNYAVDDDIIEDALELLAPRVSDAIWALLEDSRVGRKVSKKVSKAYLKAHIMGDDDWREEIKDAI